MLEAPKGLFYHMYTNKCNKGFSHITDEEIRLKLVIVIYSNTIISKKTCSITK